jgi:hypothetical protein
MPPTDPPLFWLRLVRGKTILPHHVPNPLQSDGAIGSNILHDLPSDEFRVPLQYLADADSHSGEAINMPTNPLLRRAMLGRRHPTGSQVRISPNDTQPMIGSHTLDYLLCGARRVLVPKRLHPSSYHVVL